MSEDVYGAARKALKEWMDATRKWVDEQEALGWPIPKYEPRVSEPIVIPEVITVVITLNGDSSDYYVRSTASRERYSFWFKDIPFDRKCAIEGINTVLKHVLKVEETKGE